VEDQNGERGAGSVPGRTKGEEMKRIKKMVDDLSKAYPSYAVGVTIHISSYADPEIFLCIRRGCENVVHAKTHLNLQSLKVAINKLLLEGKK
jgi:hypothetical protein